MGNPLRRSAGALVLGTLILISTAPLFAAFPRLVLISGAGMTAPVALTDWPKVAELLQYLGPQKPVSSVDLEGRSFFQVTMFWGPQWKEFMERGEPLSTLRHDQGNQFGRLYPATATSPAILVLTHAPRHFDGRLTPPAALSGFPQAFVLTAVPLGILARGGVPVGP